MKLLIKVIDILWTLAAAYDAWRERRRERRELELAPAWERGALPICYRCAGDRRIPYGFPDAVTLACHFCGGDARGRFTVPGRSRSSSSIRNPKPAADDDTPKVA